MMYLTFAATGLFLIAAAVFDWDLWFVDWETGFVGAGVIFVTLLHVLGRR